MKRRLDIAFAVFALLFLFPLLFLIALFIKAGDGGPIIFLQFRAGQYKRPFKVYKFRTMRDGKITRVGYWLRKTGLDELAQIINILKGEMSVVGPRPLTYEDIERLGWGTRYHISRWHLKPGITGLAQLYAGRSAHYSWFYDKVYSKTASPILDLKIIILSFIMNIIGKQRVRNWLHGQRATKVNWKRWLLLFSSRRQRPMPDEFEDNSQQTWSEDLAKSLAIFQLGESGGGTVIQQAINSPLHGVNPDYCQSMQWFVDEEHRHADILAYCVTSLGGQCITHNWTAKLFVAGRRLMGLRLKILVLLAAEVVGICYYKLLAMRLPMGELRDSLDQLATDEEAHLQFHSDFLRLYVRDGVSALIFKLVWRSVTYAALVVVTIDHRRALRSMDIPLMLVWRRWLFLVKETEIQIIAKSPNYLFLQQVNDDYHLFPIK